MTISLGMPTMPPTAPAGVGNLRGTQQFPHAARHDLKNSVQRHNLRMATHTIRDKRARVVNEIDDWQALRRAGSAIKRDVMARMPELLEQFEKAVVARGGHVHWARDAKEANTIITDLVKKTGEDKVVKIKSMATMEIGLNDALKDAGIQARETDLAELIVQLGRDRPLWFRLFTETALRSAISSSKRCRIPTRASQTTLPTWPKHPACSSGSSLWMRKWRSPE